MKVENTNWSWLSKEEGIRHATRNLENINMSVTENFGKYRLCIIHSFKMTGDTYYDLESKEMVSACSEADKIAMKEFKDLVAWNTNLIKELSDMNFYEFNSFDYGYYALIGAKTEEEAIKFYSETVADIEDEDGSPTEISKEEAELKLINVCNKDEILNVKADFNKNALLSEPYLVLIDGSLL